MQHKIIQFGDFYVTVSGVVFSMFYILAVFLILRGLKFMIFRSRRLTPSKKYAFFSLSRYLILILGFMAGLQLLGVNLSVLVAGSAALLVGLGFGLQSLFSDFVSGIILLVDSTIKVNDIIEVGNTVGEVQSINLRTTVVRTRDEKYIVLPNTELTKNRIINWTHQALASRFEIKVGVDYGSDVDKVMEILVRCAWQSDKVLRTPAPYARFEDYEDSALLFKLYFYSEDVFRIMDVQSELRRMIWGEFKKHAIVVPFPQRVIHSADLHANKKLNRAGRSDSGTGNR